MAIKKSPPKQKHHFSRRTIILSLVALILATLAVLTTVQSAQKQELDRKDREKFTVLEADMTKLQTQLNMSGGAGEWSLDKSCSKPGIKFYTGDAGSCLVEVKPIDESSSPSLADLKSSISMVARVKSEGRDEGAAKDFIGFTFKGSENECSVYFVKNPDLTLTQVNFLCNRPALHMYYPEK